MNGGGGVTSPLSLRVPVSSASPSGSNNTTTGRPPLWTSSSQRKVSRLYLYTTLPLQKIIEVVHAKSPDAAPGKESANKKLNTLLDKEPRWLHPRTDSDMGRRLNELALSPTRSQSSRSSETPPPHIVTDPVLLKPDPSPAMKREVGTSPTTLEVPPFHQFPPPTYNAPSVVPGPSQTPRQARRSMGADNGGHLSGFLRRTTFMSSSTQGTTGSLQRVLADYSDSYIRTVRRLVKRYTAPIHHRGESLSPISDLGPKTSLLNDEDAPPCLPNKPYFLPGDFLSLDALINQQPRCFPNAEEHTKRSCLCFACDEIVDSKFVNACGLTPDAQALLANGIVGVDLSVCDPFNNSVLHLLAARGEVDQLVQAIDHCTPILNQRNTAGQTFIHVLNPFWLFRPDLLAQLLNVLAQRGFDIYARDHWGRTLFHLLLAEDIPRYTFDHLIANFPDVVNHMKRDAFNVTPTPAPEPAVAIRHVYTQTMDLDPPQSASPIPPSQDVFGNADLARESELLEFVRSAPEKPDAEYLDGRNGLHCLAAAALSTSSVMRKHGLENASAQPNQRKKRGQEPRDLDSSTERLKLRLSLLEGLLHAGVDPNHYDAAGNTPLMAFAALLPEDDDYKAGPEILSRLIAAGAEVNARNRAGETALHIAVRCGRKLAVRTLVSNGANVHARDAAGRSLLQVTDVKMHATCGENPKQYAHFEACRAWLSGSKSMAVQSPTVLQEWGFATRAGSS